MKKHFLVSFFFIFALLSCTATTNVVRKSKIIDITPKPAVSWDIIECEKILDFYTVDNSAAFGHKVFIKALLLNKLSIQAMSRKEVIEKRLDENDFYSILDNYLKLFTSYKYDSSSKEIVESDPKFSKGYTFKFYFENISEPYEPIFLEDGYSYFFLENMKEEFSRVTEVSGLFVEDYFQLDGYLDAVITFSPFSSKGKRLFVGKNLNDSFRLVFNGLQSESIGLRWVLK